MKKNKLIKTLAMALIVVSMAPNVAASIPSVKLNSQKLLLQQSPFIENGRTYIPLRAVSENLGATVLWDNKTKTVTINQGYKTITCREKNNTARVNNRIVTLDAPPQVKNGTVYVPLRFTADCLGVGLSWDKATNTLNLTYSQEGGLNKKYDTWGREIRTTNLPTNAKDFSYILKGIPNEMYQLKPKYAYSSKKVEGKDYARPVNIATSEYSKNYYSEENVELWKSIIEKNLNLKFNADYQTIGNTWAEQMTVTYMDSKVGGGYYNRNLADTKKYVEYIKNNKIVIEGDYYVEPSICYATSGVFYIRTWVKFKATSSKVTEFKLYEKNAENIKTNTWYEGYVDIAVGTNDGNSTGTDFGITSDTISLTAGIKAVKTSN